MKKQQGKTMLPQMLLEMVEFLKKQNLHLSTQSRDGRINSAFNEDEIFNLLEQHFSINRPNMRDWVDFSFSENEVFIPVYSKVSTSITTDNLNCKLGIYYALTGQIPPFNNSVFWEMYFKALSENLQSNTADYYFLIINKDSPSDVFATSLKGLESISPNGNNLPFQAKWDNNRSFIQRDFTQARDFILHTFEESLKLRADAYLSFRKYFYES